MNYKWIRLEQKWIGSRKLDFLPTPRNNVDSKRLHEPWYTVCERDKYWRE